MQHHKQVQDALDTFLTSEVPYQAVMVGFSNKDIWKILVKDFEADKTNWLLLVPAYLDIYEDTQRVDTSELLSAVQDAFLRSHFYLFYKLLHPELSDDCIEQSIFYDYWSKKLSDVFVSIENGTEMKHMWLN